MCVYLPGKSLICRTRLTNTEMELSQKIHSLGEEIVNEGTEEIKTNEHNEEGKTKTIRRTEPCLCNITIVHNYRPEQEELEQNISVCSNGESTENEQNEEGNRSRRQSKKRRTETIRRNEPSLCNITIVRNYRPEVERSIEFRCDNDFQSCLIYHIFERIPCEYRHLDFDETTGRGTAVYKNLFSAKFVAKCLRGVRLTFDQQKLTFKRSFEVWVLQSIGNRQMPTYNYHGHNFASKTSAIVQPMFPSTATPEKENQPMKPITMSPVLPGTASITHNVTRMLQDDGTSVKRSPSSSENRYAPYTTAHFMAYRQKMLNKTDNNRSANSEDDSILDVENESHEHLRSSDMPSFTDTSLSTQGSSSPQSNGSSTSPSGSAKSSPSSTGEPVTTPDSETKVGKKKVRTNYTNEQVQTLLKIFHENPYPESEHMERIALDLGVAENKIKIWFQNKRARWRRRVNDNMTGFPYMPMSPMLSPVNPYGFMPTGHMMTSSPPQMMPGYFNYAAMQPPFSPNNNVQANSRVHPAYPIVTSSTQQYPGTSTYQQSNMAATTYPSRTSPTQPGMMSQAYRNLQYPQYLYPQQNNQHGV